MEAVVVSAGIGLSVGALLMLAGVGWLFINGWRREE
jgi:hypothetical protein